MSAMYLKKTTLYQEIERRYEEVTTYCDVLERRIKKYPEGKIHVIKSGNSSQFYLRNRADDKSGTYISKTNKNSIKLYLQKRYDEKIYKMLKREQKSLARSLSTTKNIDLLIQSVYSNYPDEVKGIVEPIDISDGDYAKKWLSVSYKGKSIAPDVTTFITNRGEHVRSKSELNIANLLDRYGIPYKYEKPLTIAGGQVIYPDFTVLDVKHRKELYWEHRGMMDDREYAKHAVQRMKQLAKEGIILGDNLIITEETSVNALGTDEIELIIKKLL